MTTLTDVINNRLTAEQRTSANKTANIFNLGEFLGLGNDPQMTQLVVTNADSVNGAVVMTDPDTIRKVHEMLGDFIALPSSIHEIICVPNDKNYAVYLDMVRDINYSQVAPEERLSDNIFIYQNEELVEYC